MGNMSGALRDRKAIGSDKGTRGRWQRRSGRPDIASPLGKALVVLPAVSHLAPRAHAAASRHILRAGGGQSGSGDTLVRRSFRGDRALESTLSALFASAAQGDAVASEKLFQALYAELH